MTWYFGGTSAINCPIDTQMSPSFKNALKREEAQGCISKSGNILMDIHKFLSIPILKKPGRIVSAAYKAQKPYQNDWDKNGFIFDKSDTGAKIDLSHHFQS